MELKIRLPVTAELNEYDRIEFQKLSFGVDYARKIDALESSITDKTLAEFSFSPLEKSKSCKHIFKTACLQKMANELSQLILVSFDFLYPK